MAILAFDNFQRANGDLGTGNWTDDGGNNGVAQPNSIQITSDAITPNASKLPRVGQYWNALSWPNDQKSQVTLGVVNATTGGGIGAVCRASALNTHYGVIALPQFSLYQFEILSVGVVIASHNISVVPATGDVVLISAQGTTIIVKINGTAAYTVTDATLATGSAGVAGYNADTKSIAGAWIGSDFAAPAPASLSTASGKQGSTNATFTVTGTEFDANGASTLSFSGAGITVNSYSVRNATTITASITIAANAALTARDVIITNTDTQTGTLAAAFTVTSGAPVPATINPTNGVQGATLNVTVSGTNFSTGTLSFSGAGITINSYSVQNSTTITANISIDPAAAATARDVIVTNADTQTGTLAAAFTVTASSTAPPSSTSSGTFSTSMSDGGTGMDTLFRRTRQIATSTEGKSQA